MQHCSACSAAQLCLLLACGERSFFFLFTIHWQQAHVERVFTLISVYALQLVGPKKKKKKKKPACQRQCEERRHTLHKRGSPSSRFPEDDGRVAKQQPCVLSHQHRSARP
jgi:hypothetical protein